MTAPPEGARGDLPSAASRSSAPRIDPYLGATLDGRYLIEDLLGEGGMGFVYRGRHKLIDKRVAIKVLRNDLAANHEMTERFLNEARAASSIGNPHIVDISDFGRLPDGGTYFVMEYIDGHSLAAVLEDCRTLPARRLVHIAKQIARGLAAAHAAGIVHRDLKPDNVMLVTRGNDADFVKILDFGIAKVGSETGRLTRAGSIFGTPHYMSPEQAAGIPVNKRTDIYSLGIILYELASGRVPFDADNPMGILTQHMYKAPAPIHALLTEPFDIPHGLEAIILKCMAKRVEDRYQSMEEVIVELEKTEQGVPPEAIVEIGRSGKFRVPPDYFATRDAAEGTLMELPAVRAPFAKLAMAAVVVGGVILAGGIVAARLVTSPSGAGRTAAAASAAPLGTSASAAVEGAPVVAARSYKQVQIVAEPIDAEVWLEDSNLGPQPATLQIGPDDHVTVRVRHPSYKTQTFTVDASKARVAVKLEHDVAAAASAVKPGPAPKAVARPPSGSAGTAVMPPSPPSPPVPQKPTLQPCPPEKFRDPFTGQCH